MTIYFGSLHTWHYSNYSRMIALQIIATHIKPRLIGLLNSSSPPFSRSPSYAIHFAPKSKSKSHAPQFY
eukprot:scaffold5668_cov87-Skeletonema_marinoi.AAC.3